MILGRPLSEPSPGRCSRCGLPSCSLIGIRVRGHSCLNKMDNLLVMTSARFRRPGDTQGRIVMVNALFGRCRELFRPALQGFESFHMQVGCDTELSACQIHSESAFCCRPDPGITEFDTVSNRPQPSLNRCKCQSAIRWYPEPYSSDIDQMSPRCTRCYAPPDL